MTLAVSPETRIDPPLVYGGSRPYILDVPDRKQLIVASDAGFIPPTVQETHVAANMLNDPNAGARAIGEIFRHQQKASDAVLQSVEVELGYHDETILAGIVTDIDPQKAVSRKIWALGQFAVGARSDATALLKLGQDVAEAPNLRRTVAEEACDAQQGLSDGFPHLFRHGLPQFLRYRDLRRFVYRGQQPNGFDINEAVVDGEGYLVGDLYSVAPNRPDVAAYIAREVARLPLGQVRKNIDRAILDQQNREAFWTDKLRNIVDRQTNTHAVAVAQQMLDELDVAIKAKA